MQISCVVSHQGMQLTELHGFCYFSQILFSLARFLGLGQRLQCFHDESLVSVLDGDQVGAVVKAFEYLLNCLFRHLADFVGCFALVGGRVPMNLLATASKRTAIREPVLSENSKGQLYLKPRFSLPHSRHYPAPFSTFFLHYSHSL